MMRLMRVALAPAAEFVAAPSDQHHHRQRHQRRADRSNQQEKQRLPRPVRRRLVRGWSADRRASIGAGVLLVGPPLDRQRFGRFEKSAATRAKLGVDL